MSASEKFFVWCYARPVGWLLPYPFMGRLKYDAPGGRCVVSVNGVDYAVNRGACSSKPFNPDDMTDHEAAMGNKELTLCDPITGVVPRNVVSKRAREEEDVQTKIKKLAKFAKAR